MTKKQKITTINHDYLKFERQEEQKKHVLLRWIRVLLRGRNLLRGRFLEMFLICLLEKFWPGFWARFFGPENRVYRSTGTEISSRIRFISLNKPNPRAYFRFFDYSPSQ